MSEFPDKAPAREVGNPAHDMCGTLRIEPGKHGRIVPPLNVRRVIRTDDPVLPWLILTGTRPLARLEDAFLDDSDVRDWPYTSHTMLGAAAELAAGRTSTGHGEQQHERGDMDVEAFRT